MAEDGVCVVAVVGCRGDADAERDLERELADDERLLQCSVEALGQYDGVARRAGAEDPELVAAEPGQRLVHPHLVAQPAGQRAQEQVARFVTQRVVDLLEVVDVEEHDRCVRALATRGQDCLLDAVPEEASVREPGQLVVQRAVLELLHLAA